jgi:phospholipid N-methyltransferase
MTQRRKTVKIAEWAKPILCNVEVDGELVRVTELLQRADYLVIDRILKALGGKWNRQKQAHVFPSDAQRLLDQALDDGEAFDVRRSLEQFDTPPELARHMVELAELRQFDDVLEPSAGIGNLVQAAYDTGVELCRVQMVELDPVRVDRLRERFADRLGAEVWEGNFLEFGEYDWCDVVLMNPPFSGNQDIEHVSRAWHTLRPGGRLVAIIGPHRTPSSGRFDQTSVGFAKWLREIKAETHGLPAGTFHLSGTEVKAHLMTATKSQEEAVQGWPYPTRRRGGRRTAEPGPLLALMGVK